MEGPEFMKMWDNKDRSVPRTPRDPIEVAGALFHLSNAIEGAYGPFDSYDLSNVGELLRYVVDFVEHKERWAVLAQARLKKVLDHGVTVTSIATHSVGREALRAQLVEASQDSAPEVTDLFLRLALQELPSHTALEVTPRGTVEFRTQVNVNDATAFRVLIRLILTDEEHRKKLGCCRHCGKLFVDRQRDPGPGRPRKWYCSEKHKNKGHDSGRQRSQRRAIKYLSDHGYARDESSKAVARAYRENGKATVKELVASAKTTIQAERKHKS